MNRKTYVIAVLLPVCGTVFGNMSAREAAERYERELDEIFLDTNGVLRCSTGSSDVTIWESKGPYENAGIVNGTFLQAMCAKYAVTGDPRDLEKARRTYRGISRIYELSQEMGEGYFCKPWGWKCQDETSSDQFIYAMHGMDAYYPLATEAERREIADRIPKMARWWIRRGYVYQYLGRPLNWQRCRFLSFSALAEKYAKTGEFAAELKRLLADPAVTNDFPYRCSIARGAFPAPNGKTFYAVSPGTADIGFGAVSAVLEADPSNAYALKVMRSCYELATECILPDGSACIRMMRDEDGSWREMPPSEAFMTKSSRKDTRFNSPVLRFQGPLRINAATAVLGLVLQAPYNPDAAGWLRKNGHRIYARMVERGFGRGDPYDVQPPEVKAELKRFSKHCEGKVAWLQGYWTFLLLEKKGLFADGRKELVDLVDPMIGAITAAEDSTYGGHGLGKTFPGAATPFGMVQLSPDTVTGGDNGPGYSYHHKTIEGFSFTHMSGIGWYGDLGNFQVMPGTCDKSVFSHDEEHAEAGYYRVRLPDAGVTAELTAAPRAGMIRFTYEHGGTGTFKIDLARRIGELTRAKPHGEQTFTRVGDDGFEGRIVCDHRDGGWGRGAGEADYTMYFRGRCSKKLDRLTFTGGSTNLNVRAEFPVSEGEEVLLHVAISFDRMPPMPEGFGFDAMRLSAREAWKKALGCVDVKGATERDRRIFATALYHAMIDPRAIGDGDGFVRRTVFSGWDVFRSEMPLLTLVRPDIVRDTILSMAETVESGKRKTLPIWDLFGCRSDCMLGNPIIPVIAGAVEAGVADFDVKKVYRLARETSAIRGNLECFGCSTNGVSLSQTLEYAFTDWCMARLAERYGTPEEVNRFDARAMWYTNCWDASVGWMRGFGFGGKRVPWRGRLAYRSATAESNPFQQAFFVPHDPEGLIALMGGKRRFTEELETLFECSPRDFLWNDYYNHPNEPCHTLPFLFAFSDKPHLVGKWTRRILSRAYGDGVTGLCGNDDVGQMSAWYVLASIGIHPLNPADGRWIVTAPLFSETTLRLDTRYAKAPSFTIRASGAEDPANVCVRKISLNGRALDRPWVTTAEIFAGGVLDIELGPEPEPWKMFDRRLGMFIHWGIYSAGGWQEQERMRKSVSRKEYAKYTASFTASKFDADAFVDAAESMGAEYIVFTAKHHDGFCLWDTETTDFNVMNTPAKRDVLKELADACRRRGMKLGLYYSNPDWNHPNAYNPKSSHQVPPEKGDRPDMAAYRGYVKAQVTELLTRYGEICCFFWDIPTRIDAPEMNELVRRLQPGIMINDRGWQKGGDYSTPERGGPPNAAYSRFTEACDSVGAQSWGYRRNEDYRTLRYLTRAIDRTLAKGGNFLLNVGPKADGTIPREALDILRKVGEWHGRVRESYRGVETVTNLVRNVTVTRRGDTVYLHYPDGVDATGLDLAPLDVRPDSVKVLNNGSFQKYDVEYLPSAFRTDRRPSVHVTGLDAESLDDEAVVLRLELPTAGGKR